MVGGGESAVDVNYEMNINAQLNFLMSIVDSNSLATVWFIFGPQFN